MVACASGGRWVLVSGLWWYSALRGDKCMVVSGLSVRKAVWIVKGWWSTVRESRRVVVSGLVAEESWLVMKMVEDW